MADEITPINNNIVDTIVDVETAKQQWKAYQQLCKELLDDSDYQKYEQTIKGKTVIKQFPKKSAWVKLGRAFNVNTTIVDKEFVLGKNGETKEAYYCIRATLPNGRSVESDGSCSRHEKGKGNATSHTIRSTAKTRASNRAIAELIGAGEVSNEELDPNFDNGKKIYDDEVEVIETTATSPGFTTADQLPNVEDFINDIICELKDDGNEVTKRNIIRCSWSKVTNKEITEEFHHEVVSWCKVNCPEDPNKEMVE